MISFDDFTLDELKAFRTALVRAMVSGTRRVTAGDRTVEYRSVDEMERALGLLDQAIGSRSNLTRVQSIRLNTSSGW